MPMTQLLKAKLQRRLANRWGTIIEEDNKTDGFYEDLAQELGHDDVSKLTDEECQFANSVIEAATKWLVLMKQVP